MDAVAVRRGMESGEAMHSCGSGLGREAVGLGLPCLGPVGGVGRRNGFALLGESLLAIAPKGTKKSCPYIRVSLRSTSLISSLLRGSPRKGHPWPFTALAASMPLAPLRSDSIRPPERGVRRRLAGRAMERQEAVSSQLVGWVQPINHGRWASPILRLSKALQSISAFDGIQTTCTQTPISPMRSGSISDASSVGWKTAKHFPPQSTQRLVSNFARKNRWVSFALPTLRSERGAGWRLAASSSANKRSAFVSLFTIFQAARTRVPFRRPSAGAAQGDARHGCRARSDGTWMSLREGAPSPIPRSSAGGREVLRSKTRMQGWPSFWLLFLDHTRKSDSPSRAKPMPQPTLPTAVTARTQSPKASRSRPLPRKAQSKLPLATRPTAVTMRTQSPKASQSRPLPRKAKTLPC